MKASHWALIPLAIISTSAHATTYLTVEQAQRAIFPGASFAATGQSGIWRTSNGSYFVVDRVVGKHEFITIAVGINANGTVKQIEIMNYRESYGYEVRDAAWRAQFVGKSASSPLQLNEYQRRHAFLEARDRRRQAYPPEIRVEPEARMIECVHRLPGGEWREAISLSTPRPPSTPRR
jgi:hypothetical protein